MKNNEYSKLCKTIDDTKILAKRFAELAKDGCFVSLYGDIGAGKTAFVRLVAEALGIKEKVTSPSFTIVNAYGKNKDDLVFINIIVIADTLRPEAKPSLDLIKNAGIKTITDELREYSEGKQLTFVEWAEFSQGEVPFDRIDINVTYDDDDNRCYTFKAEGEGKQDIIEGLKKC